MAQEEERYQEMRGDYSLSFNLLLRARRRQWNSTPRDIEVTCEAHLEPQAGLVLLGGLRLDPTGSVQYKC